MKHTRPYTLPANADLTRAVLEGVARRNGRRATPNRRRARRPLILIGSAVLALITWMVVRG